MVIYEPENVSFDLLVVSGNGRALSRMCSGFLLGSREDRPCLISNYLKVSQHAPDLGVSLCVLIKGLSAAVGKIEVLSQSSFYC